jgi:hypothetical protein
MAGHGSRSWPRDRNGAYTVIAQAAAESSASVEKVTVLIGDSDLPPAPVAGGPTHRQLFDCDDGVRAIR